MKDGYQIQTDSIKIQISAANEKKIVKQEILIWRKKKVHKFASI